MDSGIPDCAAGARLSIDLDALASNYRLIAQRVAPARLAGVVKANGYGLGAARVAGALMQAGCRDFFVAHLCEAAELIRSLGPGVHVFILNGLQPGCEPHCAALGAIPVLNSLPQIDRWRALSRTQDAPPPAAIQVDSGMGRLGLSAQEVEVLAADPTRLDGLRISWLMSHLACADDSASPANDAQRRQFDRLCAALPLARRSLANSGGAFLSGAFHYDMVRAGIALYGAAPNDAPDAGLLPVVRLEAPIVQTRCVPAGQGLGYGLTGAAGTDRRIAVISVGYADGWPRRLGGRGSAFIGGRRVPIVGRISMDSMLLDISGVPDAEPGMPVELLGDHQTLDDVARDAETISYEILTQLGSRYARRYEQATASQTSRSIVA